MPTLLQINVDANNGSNGSIASDIGTQALARGWKSYIAYGRKHIPCDSKLIRIGNNFDIMVHGIVTRLFDMHGLGSVIATRRFINKIEKLVYFLYDNDENDSRGHRPIQNFLGGFKGTIQSDGYTVYRQITNDKPDIELILCWAHVHAKLRYAELSGDSNVKYILPLVQRLYSIESECVACHLTADEIKKRRSRSDVTAILNELYDKATRLLNDPHSHLSDMMEKALKYMLNNWDGLLKYRNDGRYTIDNMPAERAIRPFTVNRNNTKFFSSEEGVKVAATLFTIVETARQYGVNVRDYLVYALREVMNGNKDCSTYTPQAYVAQ